MQFPRRLQRAIPAAMTLFIFSGLMLPAAAQAADKKPHYLITNNDDAQANSATFFQVLSSGSLKQIAIINTGGTGVNGVGEVATKRLSILDSSTQKCAFISDAGSVDVAGISIDTLAATGTFKASSTDSAPYGSTVVNNGKYLYASFTGSNTIGTYQIASGCTLVFLGDVPAAGFNGAQMIDMQVHDNILVTSFGDGSIASFNVSNGLPVSNGDQQISTGYTKDGSVPNGVDISRNGHYALFGGTVTPPLIEVSNISSGKLTPTVVYSDLGSGGESAAIWLSPDEDLLYFSNFSTDGLSAAFFDKTTGALTFGCLDNLGQTGWEAGIATDHQSGSGSVIYVANAVNLISFANVTVRDGSCSLEQNAKSPISDGQVPGLDSIASYPPRPF
jgi:hypothetical protein